MLFLGNLVSCVSLLPPESVPVYPELDRRLFSALSQLCVARPEFRRLLPGIANTAVTAVLEEKTLATLVQLADEMDVDIDACTSKQEIVEVLLSSGKSLRAPSPGTGGGGPALENRSMVDLCLLAQEKDVDITPCRGQAIRILQASGKELQPTRDGSTDLVALVSLFGMTLGGGQTRTGWARFVTPHDCVEKADVDGDADRIIKLSLSKKGLTGALCFFALFQECSSRQNICQFSRRPHMHIFNVVVACGGEMFPTKTLVLLTHVFVASPGPIQAVIGNMTALGFLHLQDNHLNGE